MTCTMFLAVSNPSSSFLHSSPSSSSSSTGRRTPSYCFFSSSASSIPKSAIFQQIKCISQLGLTPFCQWNGLKLMGVSISQYSVKIERKRKCKGRVYASLFGVGAPEVLVIGVVALLVFGPKGLAEVARNLGQTLRAFQPTIKELQEVSREFKSTLEREIGLDDIDNPVPKSSNLDKTKPAAGDKSEDLGANIEPNGSSTEDTEDSADDYLKVKADRFRGALAQLQKEQEEEREREREKEKEKEKEIEREEEKAQIEAESQSPSRVTPISENAGNNALQEAASVVTPTPNAETQI